MISYQLYFDDPRLRMTLVGRLVVRVVTWVFYLSLLSATALFLVSDITRVRWIGIGLLLFLIDRVVHRGEADIPIGELPTAGGKVNIAKVMRPAALSFLERAFDRAAIARYDFYLELALKLWDQEDVRAVLMRLDVKPDEFKQKLEGMLPESAKEQAHDRAGVTKEIETLVLQAFREAVAAGHNFIGPEDCFVALADVGGELIDRLFTVFSIEPGDLARAFVLTDAARAMRGVRGLGGFARAVHHRAPHRIMNRAWTSRPTPLLDRYSDDLTDMARESATGFLIGHEEEYTRLVTTLARPVHPNALLVGEAGIGKETIINHLAFRLTRDDVPQPLFDRRLVSLRLPELLAGAPPEELHARLQEIASEIEIAGNIILYIPDIHNLMHTSGTAYLSAADALMPIIMSDVFPVIGTSYPREFKQALEARSDIAGAFEVIQVQEISPADAEKVLAYESVLLEREYRITVSFGAIKRAVTLAKRFIRGKFLPASAEELLKSAFTEAKARGEKVLTPDRVVAVAESEVHVPIHAASEEEASSLLHLEDTIHERLVDQEEAVKAVAEAIREYRSGIARQGGPIASFLFVGPTGVGKTELAKILAKVQFGSEKDMVRFDMTEYQDKQSFFRLIGAPDGSTRGALTEAILEKPYALVLLDEFEKAFPDILNLFLQVLDDGRLTDNLGRVVDFTNTIIIATSNAHSDLINESLSKGEPMANIAEYLKSRLIDVFKPELINRFSKVVVFKDLAPDDLLKIVLLNLGELGETVKAQGMTLDFDPPAVKRLAGLGFDPKFGARPLRRVIDEKLRAPLAEAILSKKITRGSRVKLVLNGEEFTFEEETSPSPFQREVRRGS
jgi:ATP-dependent Clp protease ATP-binding subunit ClpC